MKQITDIRYTLNFATPGLFGAIATASYEFDVNVRSISDVLKCIESNDWHVIDANSTTETRIDKDEMVIYTTVKINIYVWNCENNIKSTFKKITEIENA